MVLAGLGQRGPDRRGALQFAVALGLLVTASMWAIAIAVGTEPCFSGLSFSATGNGPGGLISVELSIVLQLTMMSAAAACATGLMPSPLWP